MNETFNLLFRVQPERIHKRLHKVSYTYQNETYSIPVFIKARRPSIFIDATGIREDGTKVNIGELVTELLGPNENFHGLSLQVKDLGFHQLEVWSKDDLDEPTLQLLEANDTIKLQ